MLLRRLALLLCVFFNDPATTEIYTLSLHDALPISASRETSGSERALQGGRDVPHALGRRPGRRPSACGTSRPPCSARSEPLVSRLAEIGRASCRERV